MGCSKRLKTKDDTPLTSTAQPDAMDTDSADPESSAPRVDIRASFRASFPIYSHDEGVLYHRLKTKRPPVAHYINWEEIAKFGVVSELDSYLKVLGLWKYAHTVWECYSPLCFEFLASMSFATPLTAIFFRLMGKDYQANSKVMFQVFGFRKDGGITSVRGFDPAEAWKDLTGLDNWRSGGISSGFIRNPTMNILHRFIVYNVIGREDAGKVHKTELFLLHCALKQRKVCPAPFIFASLQNIVSLQSYAAAMPHLATGLAQKFKAIPSDFRSSTQTRLEVKYLGYSELKHALIARDETSFVPYEERSMVKRYHASVLAQSLAPPVTSPVADAENDAEDGEDPNDGNAGEPFVQIEHSQPSSSSPPTHSSQFDFHSFQADFNAFRTDLGHQIGQLQQSVALQGQQLNAQQGYWQQNEQRWEVNDQRWATTEQHWSQATQYFSDQQRYWTEQAQFWNANQHNWEEQRQYNAEQNQRMTSLEEHMARWQLPPRGSPPPPGGRQ